MDNYWSYKCVLVNNDLHSENVVVLYLLLYTSDKMQPLDTEIFGEMKKYINNFKKDPNLLYLFNQIWQIHHSLNRTCISSNCKSAFRSIGIDSELILINNQMK